MAEYVPFVNTERDCQILQSYYADAEVVRISLESSAKTAQKLPKNIGIWVDGGVDGLGKPLMQGPYQTFVRRFAGYQDIADPAFQKKPLQATVEAFVSALLNDCAALKPSWISVPQLPVVADNGRNKINRALAEATAQWSTRTNFEGKLILPVIFTHQDQLASKTIRNPRVKLLAECFAKSRAQGYWVVEASLNDQDGSKTFEQKRFPALVNLHEEVKASLPRDATSIAGPYWGMNLVLWARGLVSRPAIGLGNAFQYHPPGGMLMQGKSRIAIPPLRRWAVASPQLRHWLHAVVKRLPNVDPAYSEFQSLERDFDKISLDGRLQISKFYRQWFGKIASNPPPGRALALYQDLSTAFVLGKTLPDLPSDEGTGRKPYRVAKQFMLSCL